MTSFIRPAVAMAAAAAFQIVHAQEGGQLGAITVEDSRHADGLNLDAPSGAASRLGLSVRETPASVEILPQEAMQQRGARTFSEALRGMTGLSGGGNPANATTLTLRGFNNITALGTPVPMHIGEAYDNPGTALVPPMRIEDFRMTSISPAV